MTTDANGEIPNQKLAAFTLLTDDSANYKSEVIVGGVNYTCNANHKAETANKPPNTSYWDVGGTEGFPWIEKKKYSNGAVGGISWTNHGPFVIEGVQEGYEEVREGFAPDIDNEGETKTVAAVRSSIMIDQERVIA